MSDNIIFEAKDYIGYVTLNRPDQRNAINLETWNSLDEYWQKVDGDDDIRAIVLSGAGEKAFSAGMDLKEVARLRKEGKADFLKLLKDPMMRNMRKVRKPIIAAMNGDVFAGGFLMALNSDIRVGVEGTNFAITESKMGRGSPWGIPLLWMLPLGIVMELTLTGNNIPAERMYRLGFINRLVKRQELMPVAVSIAERIRDNAPLSVMAGKEALLEGISLGQEAGFKRALEIYKSVYESEDAQEGPKAFAEKRSPVWKGR